MTAGRTVNSLSKEWGTPEKYVEAVRSFFGEIDLDPCSNCFSIVGAKNEYRLPSDGLCLPWYGRVYVNPPYGRDAERGTHISDWLRRCSEVKAEVVALIPVATNTGHWKKYIFGKASAVCFLADTRLKFLVNGRDGGKGAPMACAMVYWGTNAEQFDQVFSQYGEVWQLGL